MTERHANVLRVLLISPLPPPEGGIATWTRLILSTPTPPDIELVHVDSSPRTLRHYTSSLTFSRLFQQLGLTTRLLWWVFATRPDVVHMTSSYDRAWSRDALVLAWARLCGAATIVNLRGGDFDRFFNAQSPRRQRKIRRDLASCARVVVITTESERFLLSLGLSNVLIIPNCIDVRRRPAHRVTSLRRWLYVGWVTPAKGLFELLDALRGIPDAHLTLVGPLVTERDGDAAKVLARARLDPELAERISHIPPMPPGEIRAEYSKHDLFVFPTRREGFPNAILEAMEAGLPIVATKVGAIPEMLEDRKHAVLIEPRDAVSLVNAIRELASDVGAAQNLAAAARDRVRELYDVNRITARWQELYRSVSLRSGHRPPFVARPELLHTDNRE